MPVSRVFHALRRAAVSALFLGLSFGAGAAQDLKPAPALDGKPQMLAVDKAPLLFDGAENKPAFAAEIARTGEENRRGLMFRRIFPKDRAMLFMLGAAQVQTMWMENTPLPLDMVFADEKGKIVHVFEGAKPYSRNLISSVYPVSYVVELNAGTVKAAGIQPGQFIRHPVICGKCEG